MKHTFYGQGLEKGLEKGQLITNFKIAEKMDNLKTDWTFITNITGLTHEDLIEWIKNGRQ